jgi:hypothetical protein
LRATVVVVFDDAPGMVALAVALVTTNVPSSAAKPTPRQTTTRR